MKNFSMLACLMLSAGLVGCSGAPGAGTDTGLPAVGTLTNQGYLKSRAIIDLSTGNGSTASLFNKGMSNLYAMLTGHASYASPGAACSHNPVADSNPLTDNDPLATGYQNGLGPCTDFVDISVTNAASTQFVISPDNANGPSQSFNASVANAANMSTMLSNLKITVLNDNDLYHCGSGTDRCHNVVINLYTMDSQIDGGFIPGKQLWNSSINSTSDADPAADVDLMVIPGSEALVQGSSPLADGSAGGAPHVNVDMTMISSDVLSIGALDSGDAAFNQGYQLSAALQSAAQGTYKARVVAEYLISD